MGFKEDAIGGIRWTSVSTLFLAASQLITTAILARLLTKSDFGLMAIIMVVNGFAEIFMDFGITVAILHKQNITHREYSSLYWVNMLMGFAIYAVLFLITPFLASFYENIELLKLIPLMCLAIPLSSIGRQQKTVLQKELFFKDIALVDIISSVLGLMAAIFLAYARWGVYALVLSNLIRYTVANIIYFFIGIKKVPIRFHLSFKETVPFFKIGMYNTAGQIINYFSCSFDVLIIGKLLGAEVLGVYNLAKELVVKPSAVIRPILIRVVTPLFAKIQENRGLLLSNFFNVQKFITNINAYVYLGIALLAEPIIHIYYGSGYESCVSLVIILALYYMLREYGTPIGMICIAKGRTDIDMWWNVLVLCVSPVFIYIGALYSVKAVTYNLLFLNLILLYPGWYMYARRLLQISFWSYYRSLFFSLRLFLFPVICIVLFLMFFKLPILYEFLLGGLLYTLLLFIVFWRFEKKMIQFVFQIIKR